MNIFEILNEKYTLPAKPKLFEAFAGIGCQRLAFDRLGIEVEMVGISEIDKYAIQSYMAIHGDTKNFGSICDIQSLPEVDVFTWSFPCTDLSKAGKQKGLTNTRSGLVYEVLRILHNTEHKPKVLIMENVVDLVQTKFIREFQSIQHELELMGYTNYTETMNAKDYGVAQNRDRVFMVSILGEYYYEFPKPFPLEKRLKDYLEESVDEKYYIKDYQSISDINESYSQLNGGKWDKLHDIGWRFYNTESVSPTIHTMGGGNLEPKIAETKCLNSQVNGQQPSLTDRIYDSDYISTAITTAPFYMPNYTVKNVYQNITENAFELRRKTENGDFCIQGTRVNFEESWSDTVLSGVNHNKVYEQGIRIRKLTSLECWRLMGIDDKDFRAAEKVCSNSQLYKQAGNGIVVDVFARIIEQMTEHKSNVVKTSQSSELSEPKIIEYNITQQVTVRKHEVDIESLKELLSSSKKNVGITNKQLSDQLDLPITLIEHWFRKDSSFSIPPKESWLKLREILKIETDMFDESVMEFIEKDGVFEKANRVYCESGIAPTITCVSENEKVLINGASKTKGKNI